MDIDPDDNATPERIILPVTTALPIRCLMFNLERSCSIIVSLLYVTLHKPKMLHHGQVKQGVIAKPIASVS